jgi:hypothetical protein
MRQSIVIAVSVILLIASALGISWVAARGFGMRQSIEFFPYSDQVKADNGQNITSSGVVVRVNEREAYPTDHDMAALMVSVRQMYPSECSSDNWEISIRRPLPDGEEEKYSFYSDKYDIGGPGSWIEYGRWTDGGVYTVLDSYPSTWDEVGRVADGRQEAFKIEVTQGTSNAK